MNKVMVCVLMICFMISINTVAAETKKIGVLWWPASGMANDVLKGFKEEVKKRGLDFDIEENIALKDKATAAEVYKRYQKEKDAILFLRSAGAKFVAENPSSIPVFCGACNNPEALGILKDMKRPDKNFTGVTYYLPADKQFEIYNKIFPDMKRLCLLVEEGHPSAVIDQAETKAQCKKYGVEYKDIAAKIKTGLLAYVKLLSTKMDMFVIGNQRLIMDNAADIIKKAGKVPVVAYSKKPVAAGALFAFTTDPVKRGRILVDSVVDVLINGKKVIDVPFKTDPSPKFIVNKKKLDEVGITVPAALLNSSDTEIIQ